MQIPPPPPPDPEDCNGCRKRTMFYTTVVTLALTLLAEHGLKFILTGAI